MSLTYTEAFAKFGAKLNNQQWSVSAFGADGCLVVSLWQDWIKPGELKGTLVYRLKFRHSLSPTEAGGARSTRKKFSKKCKKDLT